MPPIQEARALIAAKDWAGAESLLKEALIASPPSVETYYLHGLACFKLKKFVEAEVSLQSALAQDPGNASAMFYLANCEVGLGKHTQAARQLEKYLELVPADADGWKRLGELLTELGKPEQALDAFGRALDLDPSQDEVRWWMGVIHYRSKRYDEAARILATMDPQSPRGANAFDLGIHAAEQSLLWPTAIAIVKLWLRDQPADGAKLRQLARFEFLANNDDASLAALKQISTDATHDAPLIGRVVTTETWELLASKWVQLHLKSVPAGKTTRIRPSLTRHDRARVVCPEWLVLTEVNDLLVEQMVHDPLILHKTGPHVIALTDNRCLLDLPAATVAIDDACILVGGGHDYYHWLVDHLPRIGIADKVPALRDLKLLINEDLAAWQTDSLTALGIGPDRLQPVPRNAVARCRALWVPTLLSRRALIHPYVAGWLRRRLLTRDMKGQLPRKLFIRQAPGEGRGLANEDELAEALRSCGFDAISPHTMPFMEQIAAFSIARVIVGATTPALANLLFAPRNAAVIEIASPQTGFNRFQLLGERLGIEYRRLESQPHGQEVGIAGKLHLEPYRLIEAVAAYESRA